MKKNVKTAIAAVAAVSMIGMSSIAMTGCGNNTNTNVNNTNINQVSNEPTLVTSVEADDAYGHGVHHVVMEVEGYDPITIELNADAAPVTVSNFMHLAENGYYDGLAFYRFQEGFCMQGGTKGNNAAGNDKTIPMIIGEFTGNGQPNPMSDAFKRGTVAMARTTDPDSASSTFFVTLDTSDVVSASLNGQYAAFGMIDEDGMKIVDQIVKDRANAMKDPSLGTVSSKDDLAMINSITITD